MSEKRKRKPRQTIPNTYEQRIADNYMLGIKQIWTGLYMVGPWKLYGPAMEEVRQTPLLRTALLLANPDVPTVIKRMFSKEVQEG